MFLFVGRMEYTCDDTSSEVPYSAMAVECDEKLRRLDEEEDQV